MAGEPRAVLLLAYGGPDSLDDVEAYVADVRGGRATPPALLEELRARYALIGGGSPLLARTREQARALGLKLGPEWPVAVGMRHWSPRIASALEALAADGARQVVAVPMAPHYSALSVGAYGAACEAAPAVRRGAVSVAFVSGWSDHPGFLDAVAERVGEALARFPDGARTKTRVVFTAHSLPERVRADGDPYPDQVRASAARVAERLGLTDWRVAFQSAGATGERWLGPEAGDVIAEAAKEPVAGVLLVPIGFVSDNVEVLYDVDIAYRRRAEAMGLRFARSESLNASPLLIDALADIVRRRAAAATWA
ncbi:MAG: ferrochelatase [Gemmatimonadetes bacterium]|nr:ferrochelatase [Gemmatimonadota bacterium]